ncbi:MAG: hypothetical protein IPJ19_00070 [Planctomycetes bacterium]|nr:hypothetical protein [Planctomycetota bacterium]
MNTRLMAALLAAGTTCSLASANVVASNNPKTRQVPYVQAQQNPAVKLTAEQSKQERLLAQKLAAIASQSAPLAQSGMQQGNPTGFPSTLALGGGDDCNTPDAILGTGSFAFDNTLATTGTQGQTEAICLFFGQTGINNDVWFAWTASATGTTTVSFCGTATMDSKIAVYNGSTCPGGAAIACNDDSCALQSSVSFPATSGNTYMLQVGNFPGATAGSGSFTISGGGAGPANDDCSTAVAITGNGPFAYDTTGATTSSQQSGGCATAGQDIWYDWTAPASGNALLSLCGNSYDTVAAAYVGAGCPVGGTSYCNDDSCGLQSEVIFPVVAGSHYMLQIGGFGANSGPGSFSVTISAPTAGDSCSTPTVIAGNGTFNFDNTGATTGTEGQTEAACLAFGSTAVDNDLWYRWTATATGTATMSLCTLATMDSKIAAYAGSSCPTAGTALACNDDTCALQSEIQFAVTAGSTYMLQLGNFPGGAPGTGTFTVDVPGGGTGVSYLCDPGSVGVTACPCGNPASGSGRGCDNSSATGGASVTGAGSNALATPTLVFTTAGEKPTATTIFLQGSASNAAGLVFGQGVRCATGVLKRLYTRTASGGSVTVPNFGAGDLDIPARSAALGDPISAGQSRWYLAYYRDPIVLGGCAATSTYNCTNTAEVPWQ